MSEHSMTVKQLKERLAELPDDFEVIMQSDAEGNSYSPLSGLEGCRYEEETTWSGEVVHPDDQEGPNNAVVLWPIN